MDGPNHDRQQFAEKVGAKEARKARARREREHGIWFGLGMIGTVGWSVAVPTLVGVAVGLWLDRKSDTGISWTATMLFLGLALGCFNAYYWVKKQLNGTSRRRDGR
jgi:ATP synthase protein I